MSWRVPPRRTVMNLGSRFFGNIIRQFLRVPSAQQLAACPPFGPGARRGETAGGVCRGTGSWGEQGSKNVQSPSRPFTLCQPAVSLYLLSDRIVHHSSCVGATGSPSALAPSNISLSGVGSAFAIHEFSILLFHPTVEK